MFDYNNLVEVQIVYLHGVNYVQDLWKILSQDVSAGGPGGISWLVTVELGDPLGSRSSNSMHA